MGPNSKILPAEQSLRDVIIPSAMSGNLNLSSGKTVSTSNLSFDESVNRYVTPFSSALSQESGGVDIPLSTKLNSTESLSYAPLPPLVSTLNKDASSLSYDHTEINEQKIAESVERRRTNPKQLVIANTATSVSKLPGSKVSDVFIGSREKTPKNINTAY